MELPLQVTFRNVDRSEAVETRVQEKAQKLERFFKHMTSCRVTIEAPHRSQTKGRLYECHIDIGVPGGELVVTKAGAHASEDVYVAIRDAFAAATRQLEDYARRLSGDVKTHEPPPKVKASEIS